MPYSGGSRVVLVEILTSDERAADVLHLPRGDPGQAENESDGRADKHGVQQGRSLKDGDREACVARCHRNQQQAYRERVKVHGVLLPMRISRIHNHRSWIRCSGEHRMKKLSECIAALVWNSGVWLGGALFVFLGAWKFDAESAAGIEIRHADVPAVQFGDTLRDLETEAGPAIAS